MARKSTLLVSSVCAAALTVAPTFLTDVAPDTLSGWSAHANNGNGNGGGNGRGNGGSNGNGGGNAGGNGNGGGSASAGASRGSQGNGSARS